MKPVTPVYITRVALLYKPALLRKDILSMSQVEPEDIQKLTHHICILCYWLKWNE